MYHMFSKHGLTETRVIGCAPPPPLFDRMHIDALRVLLSLLRPPRDGTNRADGGQENRKSFETPEILVPPRSQTP